MIHDELAFEIIEYLHQQYPDASIGLSGSVALKTCTANSDIDILFCRKNIMFSYSVSFEYKGFKVSLFSFSQEVFQQNSVKYLYGFHNMPIALIYISIIHYDPKGIILDLKRMISYIIRRRVLLNKLLIENLKEKAKDILDVQLISLYDKRKSVYNINRLILSIYYLSKYPDRITLKQEGRNPLSTLKQEDYELYKTINDCLPYQINSYRIMKETLAKYLSLN